MTSMLSAGLAPAWSLDVHPEGGDMQRILPGQVARGASERTEVRISCSAEAEVLIEVDDERLEPIGRHHWSWTPGFFAGEVIVRVVQPETRREATYRIDVSPDSGKLGGKLYEAMLEDLWHEAPELLLGEEPSLRAMGIEQAAENPILTYGRLRRWGGELLRSLRPLMRAPITRLTHERRRVPIHMVRRADRHTSLALARARLMPGAERPGDPSTPLDTPAIEPSVANAANRTTLALIRRVLQAARGCVRELETRVAKEKDSATRTALSIRWPARRDFLLSLERELAKATRSAPFGALGDVESSPEGLIAAASNPIYARVHRLGWRCTARGFAGRPASDQLWLPPTWEVYECWCWVAMRGQLESEGFAETPHPKTFPNNEGAWHGVRNDGERATLLFQATFSSGSVVGHRGARSVSAEFRPDLVLLRDSERGRTFDVLDAKYRTTRSSVLEAMRSAHIYRDALRYHGARPDSAVLLVPAGGGAPWLEEREFIERERVGVRVLAPDAR